MSTKRLEKIYKLKKHPDNPRVIKDVKFNKLVKSIKEFPEMLEKRPLVVTKDLTVLGGNMRLRAAQDAGLKEIWIDETNWNKDKQREFIIKDNSGFGEWDWDELANSWEVEDLNNWGVDLPPMFNEEKEERNPLTETFAVPPFTILDTRQGYWKERKESWKEIINDNGESREKVLSKSDNIMSGINSGTSILDPVLAEIANLWFGLEKSKTFDCFAGDSVFGVVSDALGHSFTGIELREEQVDLNNARLQNKRSKYICDDGQNVLKHIKENSQDLLFSCPPYFDLEVYSKLENDASNQGSYKEFLQILDNAFTSAIKCLKNNRFAFIVVGDVRDKKGGYYGFPDDIKQIFKSSGMVLYNEMVLVEPLGTLPQRVRRWMHNRKIGKCHQNVLVFYKGDTKEIKNIYQKLEVNIGDEG